MSEGLAERKAALGGHMSTEHPVIAWSSEIGIANFQIGAIFINKPQIWVLNNYILAWKQLKTTFHDTITVIFWKLHGFLGNDVSQVHKNRQECILRNGLSVWKYKILKYTVIFFCTPTEGYQKSGTVRFAILVPFTTYDNGNGHNCVPYRTVPNRTAQWKRAIKGMHRLTLSVSSLHKHELTSCYATIGTNEV